MRRRSARLRASVRSSADVVGIGGRRDDGCALTVAGAVASGGTLASLSAAAAATAGDAASDAEPADARSATASKALPLDSASDSGCCGCGSPAAARDSWESAARLCGTWARGERLARGKGHRTAWADYPRRHLGSRQRVSLRPQRKEVVALAEGLGRVGRQGAVEERRHRAHLDEGGRGGVGRG